MVKQKQSKVRIPCTVVGCTIPATYFVINGGPICTHHLDVARMNGMVTEAWLIDPEVKVSMKLYDYCIYCNGRHQYYNCPEHKKLEELKG